MKPGNKNSYKSLKSININGKDYKYYSLVEAEKNGLKGISKLPKSLKVLLENLLRYEDDLSVTKNQIDAIQKSRKQDLRDIQSGQVQRTLNRIATEDINRVFRDQFSEEARKRNLFFNPQGLIPETEMLPQETINEFLKQNKNFLQ